MSTIVAVSEENIAAGPFADFESTLIISDITMVAA
jgi:hypothetical protein